MTIRNTLTALRDWAALAGALAMVGFLTFVPQHATVANEPEPQAVRHVATEWPSRTAVVNATALSER